MAFRDDACTEYDELSARRGKHAQEFKHRGKPLHPVILTLALIAAGWLATLLTATAIDKPNPMSIGVATLLWFAVAALVWYQWVRRPMGWLVRMAALVGLATLVTTVFAWAQQADVFVEYRRNCPPRTGTFWKLVFAWLGGVAAINYTVFGNVIDGVPRRLRDLASLQNILWWGTAAAWTGACAFVFANNITVEVARRSFTVAGLGLGRGLLFFVLIVGSIAALVWVLTTPGRRREKQAQADYLSLSEERKRDVLAMVERHARSVEHCIYYRETAAPDSGIDKAHIGGKALMPAGETWPIGPHGEAALFLLHLPLPAVLPAPWPGRVLALWLTHGFEVQVRSYEGLAGLVEVLPPPPPDDAQFALVPRRDLLPLALPVPLGHDDEAQEDEFCHLLLQDCVELRTALKAATAQPEKVLAKILNNDVRTCYLEPGGGLWVGGEPQLIQNPHEPKCELCGEQMRFLFSIGDVTEEMAFGDVGVAYVYGCDTHPEHCQGFVDCH